MLLSEVEGPLHKFPGVRRDYDKSSKSSILGLLLEEQHGAVHDLHPVLVVTKSLIVREGSCRTSRAP
jgi:hypothetical protein